MGEWRAKKREMEEPQEEGRKGRKGKKEGREGGTEVEIDGEKRSLEWE